MDIIISADVVEDPLAFSAEHRRREQDLEAAFEKGIFGFSPPEIEALQVLDNGRCDELHRQLSLYAYDFGQPDHDSPEPLVDQTPDVTRTDAYELHILPCSGAQEQSDGPFDSTHRLEATKPSYQQQIQRSFEDCDSDFLCESLLLPRSLRGLDQLLLQSPVAKQFAIRLEPGLFPRQVSAQGVISTFPEHWPRQDLRPENSGRKVGSAFDRLGVSERTLPVSSDSCSTKTPLTISGGESRYSSQGLTVKIDDLLYSSIICGKVSGTPNSSSSALNISSPMPQVLLGYTGQFDMFIPDSMRSIKCSKRRCTFGVRSHPNGVIEHRCFTQDPSIEDSDFSSVILDATSPIAGILQHAHEQSCRAALQERFRTREESTFRRELHRECTIARLEGVAVGAYRYFLGSQTIEDYIAANICVCWDDCWCNKICTRFGDIRCPCSNHLSIEDH